MEQKLLLIHTDNFSDIDIYQGDWYIKQISGTTMNNTAYCYVLLERKTVNNNEIIYG